MRKSALTTKTKIYDILSWIAHDLGAILKLTVPPSGSNYQVQSKRMAEDCRTTLGHTVKRSQHDRMWASKPSQTWQRLITGKPSWWLHPLNMPLIHISMLLAALQHAKIYFWKRHWAMLWQWSFLTRELFKKHFSLNRYQDQYTHRKIYIKGLLLISNITLMSPINTLSSMFLKHYILISKLILDYRKSYFCGVSTTGLFFLHFPGESKKYIYIPHTGIIIIHTP